MKRLPDMMIDMLWVVFMAACFIAAVKELLKFLIHY